MPQGGVIVLKSRRWIHEQRMWVTVSVQDNGCGMDPLTATQVFDPFFTTKPVGQGSGLGLAMVHSFVSQVRGRVEVTTNPGGGSRFDLHFLAGPVTAEAAAEKDVAPAAVVTRPLTVLLVEDDPVVRLTSKAMLERLGHTVLDCESGDEALEVLRSAQLLDLLFTDMVMPGRLNGRELAEYSAQIRPSLPVLLTSGWLDSDNSQLNTHGRALAMLNKPFSMDDLSLALGHVISRTI
jgi:CheY-like chemotaxis protein